MTNEKDQEERRTEGEEKPRPAPQANPPATITDRSSEEKEEGKPAAQSGVGLTAVSDVASVKIAEDTGSKIRGSDEEKEKVLLSKAVLQDTIDATEKDPKGGTLGTYTYRTGNGTEQDAVLVPGTANLVVDLPAPLPTASTPNPDSVPGAHAVGPGFRGDLMPRIPNTSETGASARGYRLPPTDHHSSVPVPPAVEPVDEEVGGLVQARQVGDTNGLMMPGTMDNPEGFQQAQPVGGETEATRTTEEAERQEKMDQKRVRKIQLIIAAWFIIVIAVAAIIVVVQRDNGTEQSRESVIEIQEGTNMTTAFPTMIIPDSPLLDLLPGFTVAVLETDMERTTPQFKAYLWMVNDPRVDTYSNDRLLQRYALAAFYYATNGDQWESQQPETQLLLDPMTINRGNATAENAFNVTALNDSMTSESTFNVDDNSTPPFGGESRRRRLQFDPQGPPPYLEFAGFPLKGCRRRLQVPTTGVGLGGPQASQGFGQQGAAGGSGCGTLGVGSVWLSYDTHECRWFNQHNLTFFPTGPCHSRNGTNGTFAHLYLSSNNLDGTLPPELALLTGMQHFFVESNLLRGTIPDEIYVGWQDTIQDFWVRRNRLSGTLSTHIGLWGKTLNRLNIFGNRFAGTLPDALYGMHNVKMMALLQNQFTGTIAGELIPGLKLMRVIGFSANRFRGTVPTELGLLNTLASFTIQNNDITGTLPTELGLLQQLEYLDVSKNDMSGVIPSELGNADLKYVLSLRENPRISGSIPIEVESLLIENLYFQRTGIEGTLPHLWCNTSDTVLYDCSPGDGLCGCNCTCL